MKEIKCNGLLFAKVRPNAIIPTKNEENAGYDFYACIDEDITLKPGETKSIPTGIACGMSNDYFIQLEERGSTGSRGMKRSCGVIDSSYRGEVFISLYNASGKTLTLSNVPEIIQNGLFIVYPTSKAICQGIVLPVPKMNVKEVSYEELLSYETKRGTGKLGSSGK